MIVRQRKSERLFGIDWETASEIGVASVCWRDQTGARLKRGVEISLCDGGTEAGHRITVSRVRARQIALALAEASGMQFQRLSPWRRLSVRLSRMLEKHTIDITSQIGGEA